MAGGRDVGCVLVLMAEHSNNTTLIRVLGTLLHHPTPLVPARWSPDYCLRSPPRVHPIHTSTQSSIHTSLRCAPPIPFLLRLLPARLATLYSHLSSLFHSIHTSTQTSIHISMLFKPLLKPLFTPLFYSHFHSNLYPHLYSLPALHSVSPQAAACTSSPSSIHASILVHPQFF